MINIPYDYEELRNGYMLYFKSDQNIRIECYFDDNGNITCIGTDNNEYDRGENATYGIFVLVDKKLLTLAQLCDVVEYQAIDLMREMKSEQAAEREHERVLSCPRLTGRI